MAEGIVFPLVTDLLKTLGSAVVREMGSIYGAHEELEKLQSTFAAIQAVLLDAEQKKDLSRSVMDWLTKLKDVAYDADDLFDSFSYQSTRRKVITEGKKAKKVRIFFSELNPIAFRREMGRQIKELRERLDLIADEKNKYNFQQITMNQSGGSEEIESYSYVPEEEVIGREEEKEEIVKRLLEINEKQNVSVDAIVGHGGVGKTTLAQSVFNHDRVKDAFDLRLWVCISETFNSKVIVKNIIKSATGRKPSVDEVDEMDALQKKLRDLIDGRRYLLVMDDLWNEDVGKWEDLNRLLMGGAKGSKILITTRTKLVAEASQATSSYILDDLSESNSWILFKRIALKNCEEPNMIQIGQEIGKKCFGSPLVIRTIGGLLSLKRSESEWLSFKDYDLAIMRRQENRMTQRLKLSYNHLPSHLKPCFAYCSLFQKDHWFRKKEMIQLWVAEGFVEPRGENKCLDSIGNEYFMELIQRSIFQDIKRNKYGDVAECKMHDLIHDLAQFVADRKYFTADSDIKNVNGQTRRVMYDPSSRENWSLFSIPQLKHDKLRTLLLPRFFSREELNQIGLEAQMSSLKSLRVLDLHRLRLKKVPSSIGTLKHLRFLNLSVNHEIGSLPSSLTKLHNLRTLNISHSALKKLPKDIGSLINLRDLDIFNCCSIKRLPNSVTKLKFLQTLILSCTGLKELPENIGNMLDLRILRLQMNYSIEVLPNSICNLQKLQELNLEECKSLRELPRDVSNLINLKHLNLEDCVGLRGMQLGLNKLTSLQTIGLYAVNASVSAEGSGLWQLDTLINIKGRLHIRGLHHFRKDASRANTVTLKDNYGVRDLTLEWREIGYNPNGVDLDSVVLENLHPNKNVKNLSIYGYGGVGLSSWVASLSNLMHISIVNFERLQYVPRMDRLPNLQNLYLYKNNLMEYMDNNETVEEFGSSVFFPSLRSLTIRNMDKLKGWWKPREFSPEDPGQSFSLPSFHCLVDLNIGSCPQLLSIPSPNSSLKTLYLRDFNVEMLKGELIGSTPLEDDTQPREALGARDDLHSEGVTKVATPLEVLRHLTDLQSLSIIDYNDLFVLPDWIGNLTTLHELNITRCQKLTLLSDGIGNFTALQKLTIDHCPNLTSLPDGTGNLTALQDLNIVSCLELDWIGNHTLLQELKIHDCPQLTLLADGIRNLTSLQKLTIDECSKLTLLLDQICNLTSMQKIEIRNCPKVTRLQGGNGQLSSLRRLITSGGCRRPEKRWTKQIGEDWSEISPGKFIRISK